MSGRAGLLVSLLLPPLLMRGHNADRAGCGLLAGRANAGRAARASREPAIAQWQQRSNDTNRAHTHTAMMLPGQLPRPALACVQRKHRGQQPRPRLHHRGRILRHHAPADQRNEHHR